MFVGKILTRSKGETSKVQLENKHACSPECVGKLTWKDKEYVPRESRRKTGYIYVGSERQHRLVAETMIGRPLHKGELVHHIDGDKGSNVKENLVVCESVKEHNRIHGQLESLAFLFVQKGQILFCRDCKLYFFYNKECGCNERI